MFKDLTVTVWTIVYDNDQNRMYHFSEYDKMIKSIDGSLRCYIDDDTELDGAVEYVIDYVDKHRADGCIPINFGNLNLIIFRWALDYTTTIHQVLSDCFNEVHDESLKSRIKWLYNATVNV
jgi:hypothetical protein